MSTTDLIQLNKRIEGLEQLAEEVLALAERLSKGENVQPGLATQAQRWYRGARELLAQNSFSGLSEFDHCYNSTNDRGQRSFTDIERYIEKGTNSYSDKNLWSGNTQGAEYFGLFQKYFQKARSLLLSLYDEINSRKLPIKSQLSFSVAADEFATARLVFNDNPGDEIALRVAGFTTRIALERHLLTVADTKGVEIELNPKNKKKADTNDILTSLEKAGTISPIQKSELESLFKIGNNCAHPKEVVESEHVERLITRAQELASIIL